MNPTLIKKVATLCAAFTFALSLMQAVNVFAFSQTTFSQIISDGVQSTDIVDVNGDAVASPGIAFSGLTFSFDNQTATGTLGTEAEKIRIFNPTSDATWTLSLAATNGATAAWSDGGSNNYDFNDSNADGTDGDDADSAGGNLSINPSVATLNGVSNCLADNVSLGSSSTFEDGITNSISLLTGESSASPYCRWDLTDVSVSQMVPANQAPGTYNIEFTLTIA